MFSMLITLDNYHSILLSWLWKKIIFIAVKIASAMTTVFYIALRLTFQPDIHLLIWISFTYSLQHITIRLPCTLLCGTAVCELCVHVFLHTCLRAFMHACMPVCVHVSVNGYERERWGKEKSKIRGKIEGHKGKGNWGGEQR